MGYGKDGYLDEDAEPLMKLDEDARSNQGEPQQPLSEGEPLMNFDEDARSNQGEPWQPLLEGEPLMNFDEDVRSNQEPRKHLVDDIGTSGHCQDPSPTPIHSESRAKPRRRLIKKSSTQVSDLVDFGLEDVEGDIAKGHGDDEAEMAGMVEENQLGGGNRKNENGGKGKLVGEKRKSEGKKSEKEKQTKKIKLKIRGRGVTRVHKADDEISDMWNAIIGGDVEGNREVVKTVHDDNFIDDSGVGPAEQYGSDSEDFLVHAPQAEEGDEYDEINKLFNIGKKKKKTEKSAGEIALLVEDIMAELEVAAEEDVELNQQGKPAINKLKKLSLLTDVLSKKHLQPEFLDHGILCLLKNWLEPLPDGSLPNINVRAGVLQILNDLPIDLEQNDRREQLKKSGLGKVVMFLSKSDEETLANRKLAKELVDKWSRPIFNKSIRFEEMRNYEEERASRRPSVKKLTSKTAETLVHADEFNLAEISRGSKSGQPSSRQCVSRPEAMSFDFAVRPESKVDPNEVRAARVTQNAQNQSRARINKKLDKLKASKRKQLQATKVSAEGRGMVKYL